MGIFNKTYSYYDCDTKSDGIFDSARKIALKRFCEAFAVSGTFYDCELPDGRSVFCQIPTLASGKVYDSLLFNV